MNPLQDVFISYGRADSKAFAAMLNQRLVDSGREVWFDFDDIPLGVDYQKQIDDGIAKADTFLFLISPHSIHSPYCCLEVDLAIRLNKRIIPILHVESIDRQIWQQRNPDGTDQQWVDYQDAGKHSSFTKMHPVISKINWVYMREGQDDFDASFQDLLKLLDHESEYVHHHTVVLNQALEWQRNQYQHRHLLIGNALHQAQDWLNIRFTTEQAPCMPTDLHCQFITESIKNGNNLMTQVFMAYADGDRPLMQALRRYLWRDGVTVWTSDRDIASGTDFQAAIRLGIEQTDTLLYLITPAAIASSYCQTELEYALSLKKRVIPLLLCPVDMEDQPLAIRSLQYVNLVGWAKLVLEENAADGDQGKHEQQEAIASQLDDVGLLRLLRQESVYFEQHKVLLVKALKWDRQHRNPSILLRGYNLRHAGDWLNQAKAHSMYPPTPLQTEFIEASQQQPPAQSLDVFISYSRADSDIARQINDALQLQGKRTWFDQESIAIAAADFKTEINQGIQASDNIVFILSPRSLASPYCADEVAYAAQLNKRFIPVLYQSIDPQTLPPALKKVQWIDFSYPEPHADDEDSDAETKEVHDPAQIFARGFSQLVRALDTDREHVRQHTQWSQRAIAWDAKQRTADLLLRGSEFAIAQKWLVESKQQEKQPAPTEVQTALIEASQGAIAQEQRQEKQRVMVLRSLLGVVSVAFGISAITGVFAFQQRNRVQEILGSQIESLSKYALSLVRLDQPFSGLVEAVRAGKSALEAPNSITDGDRDDILSALQQAINQTTEWQTLSHEEPVVKVAYSPDGQYIATASDTEIQLWTENGKAHTWVNDRGEVGNRLVGHGGLVTSLNFSPDGQTLVSSSEDDSTIALWSMEGELLESWTVFEARPADVAFSPDGQTLVSTGINHPFKMWSLAGEELQTVDRYEEGNSVAFSPDGDWFVIAQQDGTVTRWDRQGALLQTFVGHTDSVWDVAVSPDGQRVASASGDRTVRLWQVSDSDALSDADSEDQPDAAQQILQAKGGKGEYGQWSDLEADANLLHTFEDHTDVVTSVAFSPVHETSVAAGNIEPLLLSGSYDGTIKLWTLDLDRAEYEPLLQTFHGHGDSVDDVAFSPVPEPSLEPSSGAVGPTIVSASWDKTAKLWAIAPQSLPTLQNHQGTGDSWARIETLQFSPDSQSLIARTSEYEDTVVVWNVDGTVAHALESTGRMDGVFSPRGQPLAVELDGSTIVLKAIDGNEIQRFEGHEGRIIDVVLSADGQTLASLSEDKTVNLWSLDGTIIQTIETYGPDERVEQEIDSWVASIALSPDGRTLLSTYADGTIKRWPLDGDYKVGLANHEDYITQAIFSPDGQLIASASRDNTVVLYWDSPISDEGYSFDVLPHDADVTAIAFHPDGTLLAAGEADGVITLWHLDRNSWSGGATPRRGQTLVSRLDSIRSLAFSPDGKWLASGSEYEETIVLWELERLTLDGLMAQGCQWLTPYLIHSREVDERDRSLCEGIAAPN